MDNFMSIQHITNVSMQKRTRRMRSCIAPMNTLQHEREGGREERINRSCKWIVNKPQNQLRFVQIDSLVLLSIGFMFLMVFLIVVYVHLPHLPIVRTHVFTHMESASKKNYTIAFPVLTNNRTNTHIFALPQRY